MFYFIFTKRPWPRSLHESLIFHHRGFKGCSKDHISCLWPALRWAYSSICALVKSHPLRTESSGLWRGGPRRGDAILANHPMAATFRAHGRSLIGRHALWDVAMPGAAQPRAVTHIWTFRAQWWNTNTAHYVFWRCSYWFLYTRFLKLCIWVFTMPKVYNDKEEEEP